MVSPQFPVLFVMAPGGFTHHFPEHLGIAFLRTVLRQKNIDSRQYLPTAHPSLSGFATYLRDVRPQVLGFTVYEANLRVSRALIRVARQTLRDAIILVGGPNATFSPHDTLDLLQPDCCVRGSAEPLIVPLISTILGSDSARKNLPELLPRLPNVVLPHSRPHYQTQRSNLFPFSSTSFPTLDDLPSPFQENVVSTPDVGYLTSRGCNQHCTYCSFAALSERRVVFHSIDRVLDDLQALAALCRTHRPTKPAIQLFDDTFTLVPDRVRMICERLINKRIRLPLLCQTRGDRVTSELLSLMRRAGFIGIAFGLESAVPRILRVIGKVCPPGTSEDPHLEQERHYLQAFRTAVQDARRCGLAVSVSVMGGLPGETADDFHATLDFVRSLNVQMYAHNVLEIFPGTPLYAKRHSYGMDAFREQATGVWRTKHSYNVSDIPPLPNSSTHQDRWRGAKARADALCGRAGNVAAANGSVWAVVIHNASPSSDVFRWLRRTLAIGGMVVVLADSHTAAADWRRRLAHADVPFGSAPCLFPQLSPPSDSFAAYAAAGVRNVKLLATFSSRVARRAVSVDAAGICNLSVWIASAGDTNHHVRATGECPLFAGALQLADACWFGGAGPRCIRPLVFHLSESGTIRACWHGIEIGTVATDASDSLQSSHQQNKVQAVVASPSSTPAMCLSAFVKPPTSRTGATLANWDLASQLGWLFGRFVSTHGFSDT